MKEKNKNWKCKLGFHDWNYLPKHHAFKEGGKFLKSAIFLGHIKQIRQCKNCYRLEAKYTTSFNRSRTSIKTSSGEWLEYNEVIKYIQKNFVINNRMVAW